MGMTLGINFKDYTSVVKGLKLKVSKFCWLVLIFVEFTGAKLVERYFCVSLALSEIGLWPIF